MKAAWLFLTLFIAGMLTAKAQKSLVVADVETLLPVAGANVQGDKSVAVTDSAGRFMPPDSCRSLLVSHVNYESRLVNTDELSADTIYIISKLMNIHEVVVFGKGKIDDDRLRDLNRSLRIARTEAQLANANPNGNLLGLIGYLIPKKWRSGYRKKQRQKTHEEILREY